MKFFICLSLVEYKPEGKKPEQNQPTPATVCEDSKTGKCFVTLFFECAGNFSTIGVEIKVEMVNGKVDRIYVNVHLSKNKVEKTTRRVQKINNKEGS